MLSSIQVDTDERWPRSIQASASNRYSYQSTPASTTFSPQRPMSYMANMQRIVAIRSSPKRSSLPRNVPLLTWPWPYLLNPMFAFIAMQRSDDGHRQHCGYSAMELSSSGTAIRSSILSGSPAPVAGQSIVDLPQSLTTAPKLFMKQLRNSAHPPSAQKPTSATGCVGRALSSIAWLPLTIKQNRLNISNLVLFKRSRIVTLLA